jgi:hypothetical protein
MFPRKLEKFYTHSMHIAEFWNTLSNIPFVLIGIYRLWQGTPLTLLYFLYTMAGVCSGFHHASPHKWTIIIDWIPIATSVVIVYSTGVLWSISISTMFWIMLAFATLINDHVYTSIPVPWGHVLWHLLAAYSIDRAYQDY